MYLPGHFPAIPAEPSKLTDKMAEALEEPVIPLAMEGSQAEQIAICDCVCEVVFVVVCSWLWVCGGVCGCVIVLCLWLCVRGCVFVAVFGVRGCVFVVVFVVVSLWLCLCGCVFVVVCSWLCVCACVFVVVCL